MILFMHLLKIFTGDMGIDLGGRYVNMSKHFLNGTQIGAAFQQMAGK